MKKTFAVVTCLCSLFLVSCGSTNVPQEENNIEAPAPEDNEKADTDLPSEDEESASEDTAESTEGETEVPESDVEKPETITVGGVELQVPEDFEEPVVITLEPAEEKTPETVQQTKEEKEEPLPEEPIEVETPPEVVEVPESQNDTAVADTSTEVSENDQGQASENDDIVVEDSSSNDDVVSLEGENSEDTEEVSQSDSEKIDEAEVIVPSRKVTLKKQEYVDITYPGNGWVYMGLTDGSKDLAYFGRKLGTAETKFTLQARNAGTKIVHFYKNDALTGQYIDDYIEIEVLAEKGSNKTHVEAPEYKQPVPKNAEGKRKEEGAVADSVTTTSNEMPSGTDVSASETTPVESSSVSSTADSAAAVENVTATEEVSKSANKDKSAEEIDTDTLLKEAAVLYNEKEYKLALDKLNTFFEYATTSRDEGLYLKGRVLEAKSEVQDIKGAIDAYTTLTKNYPASKKWDAANKRVIYLKRFYLEVR